MSEVQHELAAGDVIAGRFRVEKLLGRGGMGSVYAATQTALSRPVAVKILSAHFASQPDARARFEREAKVAGALEHPGAVEIYDFGEHAGMLFIAMAALRGRTLRELLEEDREQFTLEKVIDIGYQIAEVLDAAHALQLVHRDLKPENVFLEPDGRVVVVDFGLAFIEDREGMGRMTQERIVCGTPHYMSPEQSRGDRVGPSSDVYALGVVLFELLTGSVPFDGNPMIVLTQHLFAPAPRVSFAPGAIAMPRSLEDLIARMLSKSAEGRPTAGETREALGALGAAGSAARERARDRSFLLSRASRALPRPPVGNAETRSAVAADPTGTTLPTVAILGTLEGDTIVGLSANGLVPFASSIEEASGADVVYAPGIEPEQIRRLAGCAVVSDASPADVERIRLLVRAGVAEVVPRPVSADELARRIWRAHRGQLRGRKALS